MDTQTFNPQETVKETDPAKGGNLSSRDYINQMYDGSLASQKQTLGTNYQNNLANLDAQQEKARQQTDQNLTRTYVEAAKSARNYGEVQNAYGLTSGAMAQAKLARDNQLQADMTALRGVQMNADAEVERQRGLLAKEYASAIAKAQADNDMARAQALYQEAATQEQRLLDNQMKIADLFANQLGDYSYYQKIYGLTEDQMAALRPAPVYSGGGYDRGQSYSGGGSGSSSSAPVKKPSSSAQTTDAQAILDNIKKQNSIPHSYNLATGKAEYMW